MSIQIPSSSSFTSTISSKNPSPSKAFRTSSFFTFNNEEIRKLSQLYIEANSKLPSRRVLREVSKKIGITQGRIRKWFECQQKAEQELLHENIRPTTVTNIDGNDTGMIPAFSNTSGCTGNVCTCCGQVSVMHTQLAKLEAHLQCIELAMCDLQSRVIDTQKLSLLLEKHLHS